MASKNVADRQTANAESEDPFANTEVNFKEGGRPWIAQNSNVPKFAVETKVYLVRPGSGERQGPYLIATVNNESTPIKYTLCLDDGTQINGGAEVEEGRLASYS